MEIRSKNPSWLTASLVATLVIAGIVSIFLLFSGAAQVGASWNEAEHQEERITNYFEYGWHVTDEQANSGEVDRSEPLSVYGPAFDLLGHAAAVVLGLEDFTNPLLNPTSFGVRHLVAATLGLFTSVLVGLGVYSLTRSALSGLVGSVVNLSYPLWLGHSMFNPKDIPVSFGYTAVSVGLVILFAGYWRQLGAGRQQPRTLGLSSWVVGTVIIFFGVVFGVGTRPAMLAAFVVSYLVFSTLTLLAFWIHRRSRQGAGASLLFPLGFAAAAFTAGYLSLTFIYPSVFTSWEMMWLAVSGSSSFPWPGSVFMLGDHVSMPPPRWYVPLWLMVQIPLYIVLIFALAAVKYVGNKTSGSKVRIRKWSQNPSQLAVLCGGLIIGSQLALLPLYSIISGASLYDGLRHLIFVVPALAFWLALVVFFVSRKNTVWQFSVWSVLVIGVSATTVNNVNMHPYQYASFNELTSVAGVDGVWAVDFWRVSGRELIARTPVDGPAICRPFKPGDWIDECNKNPSFAPYSGERGSRAVNPNLQIQPNQYWLLQYNRADLKLPDECKTVDQITRVNFFSKVTIGQISLCDFPEGFQSEGLS